MGSVVDAYGNDPWNGSFAIAEGIWNNSFERSGGVKAGNFPLPGTSLTLFPLRSKRAVHIQFSKLSNPACSHVATGRPSPYGKECEEVGLIQA